MYIREYKENDFMFVEERRERILKKLYKDKTLNVQQLADELNISVHTIRNDLSFLESQNHLTRTHGGAVLNEKSRINTFNTAVRYDESDPCQHAIARNAAQLIKPGMTVYIGGAVTHYLMLNYIAPNIELTVVTNSLQVAQDLSGNEQIECYIIGGKVPFSSNTVGSVAIKMLENFFFDVAFINAGVNLERGLTTSNPEVAIFQRIVIEQSKQVICLGNHYKIGAGAFSKISGLKEIDLLIIDSKWTEKEISMIKQADISYEIAKEV